MYEYFLTEGQSKRFNASFSSGDVILFVTSPGIDIQYVSNGYWVSMTPNLPIPAPLDYNGLMRIVAQNKGFHKVEIINVDQSGSVSRKIEISITVFGIGIVNDSNRDGLADTQDNANEQWVWGEYQRGAVVMVNNDKDIDEHDPANQNYSEWAEFSIIDTQLSNFPQNISMHLYSTEASAKRFSVYSKDSNGHYQIVLGNLKNGSVLVKSPALAASGGNLYLEALEYPNANFEGLITIELGLENTGTLFASDKAVFRVAPWIMTPNTLPAKRVFTCRMSPGHTNPNNQFLDELSLKLQQLNIPLTIIEPVDHLGDRWIQDEIEFGYTQSPSHTLPVVMDSPRDRGLDGFPEKELLGVDFGHFQIGGSNPNSLDSFGNLEVCPPIVANGINYPFGRIVFGGKQYGDYQEDNRQMMPEIRKFLYAQKVQSPFEINTDWLAVGHVDEIICFVPAANNIGFVVAVASIDKSKAILEDLQQQGHGSEEMFVGKMRGEPGSGESAQISIDDLLADGAFWSYNQKCQLHMDNNISILKKELEIDDSHIVDIPVLFHPLPGRTLAYFPDMVNHLVVGNSSIVPKPYGPIINGECAFEKAFKDAMPWRDVTFINDWYSYHEMSGEVHCGTNTIRFPFPSKTWWSHKPIGGYDI
ncbi:protein-arginine deiminase family protein [Colwellia sp. E150_009]